MEHVVATRYWHLLEDGRVQCDLCPRFCKLRIGQRGMCFVRANEGDTVVLTTYGRSSGFCVDPIEKKPLNHFLPGTPVLSFGTAGCNLACSFCQNWDISKSREVETLAAEASPEAIARAAEETGCRSVAFTYNDPVIFMEYAIDVAVACHARGIKTVAVTAGEICPDPRREFFAHIDAANVDLKAFTEDFYYKLCKGSLSSVLDTLVYLKRETKVWVEITTLLIPGHNDSSEEIAERSALDPREPRRGRAAALHRVSPRLPHDGRAAHTAGNAAARAAHRPGRGAALRVRGQCPRRRRQQHLLPFLRRETHRPRLVPAHRLETGRAGLLQGVRNAAAGRVRGQGGQMGPAAATGGHAALRLTTSPGKVPLSAFAPGCENPPMGSHSHPPVQHDHTFGQDRRRPGERRTVIVIGLTATMMVVEIVAGLAFGSMVLLADGLHMGSHAVALCVNVFAYVYARRHARDSRYSFGTGKVNALGGFSGAVLLAVFCLLMATESFERLLHPVAIVFDQAILVAVIGLVVNGLSAVILGAHHSHEDEVEAHDHHHDHNLRSAYLHVLADALTSVFAIAALLAGKYLGLSWMDPVMGFVGAVLVGRWSVGLLRSTSLVLLDRQGSEDARKEIEQCIQSDGDSQVTDLHLWSIGPGIFSLVMTVVAHEPATPDEYRKRLPEHRGLAHVSIEVQRRADRAPDRTLRGR